MALPLACLGAHVVVNPERFSQLGSHGVQRVQRRKRVLEHDREFGAGHLTSLLAADTEKIDVLELRGACDDVGDGFEQADERSGRHRLAAAGFAEQGEGFAAARGEGHVVDGADGARDGANVDGEAVDLEYRVGVERVGGRVFCDSGHDRAFVVLAKRDRRFCGTVRRHRCPGSVAMRAQAARMVADTVVMTIATPGKNDSHQAVCR